MTEATKLRESRQTNGEAASAEELQAAECTAEAGMEKRGKRPGTNPRHVARKDAIV